MRRFLLFGLLTISLQLMADNRPNILVVMVDDLGFSDPGCFGGEIETPHIDQLANNGLRLTQFYNAARCCPSRASMLTGCYQHKVGLSRNGNNLSKNAVTIAEVLKTAGYQTGMTGKWHLSKTQRRADKDEQLKWLSHQENYGPFAPLDTYPSNRGFDEFYGVIWGVVNYFDPFSLVHNEEQIVEVPDDFYFTDYISDKTVDLIDDYTKEDAPFFLYVAYTAPHWPLHAKPEDIEKYKGRYDGGWDKLRKDRYDRLIELGLFEELNTLLGPNSSGKKWESLSPNDKAYESEIMSVHAAMVDCVDQGIGRILQKLKAIGELDNTLIFFFSDNGGCPERGYRPGFDRNGHTRDGTRVNYDAQTGLGSEETYPYLGKAWANAVNSPFRYWKRESYEGGCHSPMIMCWPKGMKAEAGSFTPQLAHVIDILPTCLDVAEAIYPTEYNGHKIVPLDGKSLLPVINGEAREGHEALFFEHEGGRAIRMGNWKLSALRDQPWELFNLSEDRTESTDLSKQNPERLQSMNKAWVEWAKRVNAPIPAMKEPHD